MEKYSVIDARPTGGKAGKGRNKTSSVQVIEDVGNDFVQVKKIFRYSVNNFGSYLLARQKARHYTQDLNRGEHEKDHIS